MKNLLKNGRGLVYTDDVEEACWINIEEPTPSEKNYLLNEIGIPEEFYNDIEDVDERPRIEFEDGWFLIILRLPIKNDDPQLPFSTVPLGVVFNETHFISICFYKNGYYFRFHSF